MTLRRLRYSACLNPVFGLAIRPQVFVALALFQAVAHNAVIGQDRFSGANDNSIQVIAPTFWAISVADMAVSTEWYGRVFQATTLREVQSVDGKGRARILRSGPLVIELIERVGSVGRSQSLSADSHDFDMQGLVKAGVFVKDARGLHDRLSGGGLTMDRRVLRDSLLDVLTFVVRDPDGNRIQVFEEVAFPDSGEG